MRSAFSQIVLIPGIVPAISFTPSIAFCLSASETPAFHLIMETCSTVFGCANLFFACPAAKPAPNSATAAIKNSQGALRLNISNPPRRLSAEEQCHAGPPSASERQADGSPGTTHIENQEGPPFFFGAAS